MAGNDRSKPETVGFIGRLMAPPKCSMLMMATIGTVGGILIWGALNTGMEYTNRSEFCVSCHEMTIPYEELKKTAHYKNRSGTTVQCADCHVASSKTPTDYMFKSFQKLMAARDVIGHVQGTIDTPEKFEAYRLTMAQRVWERMKERDSKECRNCHDFKTMDPAKQKDRSVTRHEGAVEDGKTCIDCHKGIAHKPVHRETDESVPQTVALVPTVAAPPAAKRHERRAAPAAASAKPPMTEASVAVAVIDWSKVASRQIKLFYPGQAGLEWVLNKADHSSASDVIDKKRPCAKCHEGDANEIGAAIVAGKPVGASNTVMEPEPPADKVGFLPVTFQAAYDADKIYFRFEWVPPKNSGKKMDAKNEVKLTMMFDGGGTVEGADLTGCWSTCHTDLRTMKEARDDKKTKYVKDADLASGKFMDLIQYRSGKGEKPRDGWVDSERHMDGGKTDLKAEGRKEGNVRVVVFERELAGKGKGDHVIGPDKVYNFGFALHEDHTDARYHYVSLGYQFGLDRENPGVKNYINVRKR